MKRTLGLSLGLWVTLLCGTSAAADEVDVSFLLPRIQALEAGDKPGVLLAGMAGVCSGCTRGTKILGIKADHDLNDLSSVWGADPVKDLKVIRARIQAGTDAPGSPQAKGLELLHAHLTAAADVDAWIARPEVEKTDSVNPNAERDGEPVLAPYPSSERDLLKNRERLPDHPELEKVRAALEMRGMTGWSERDFNPKERALLASDGVAIPRGKRLGFPFAIGYIGSARDAVLRAPDGTEIKVLGGWVQSPWPTYTGADDTVFNTEKMNLFTDLILQASSAVAPPQPTAPLRADAIPQGSQGGLFGF